MRFSYCPIRKVFIKNPISSRKNQMSQIQTPDQELLIDVIRPKIVEKDGTLAFEKGVLDIALNAKGIDRDTYNKVREFDNLYIASTAAAFGLACNNKAKDSDLQSAVADVDFGGSGSKIDIMWSRQRDVPADVPKAGEKATTRVAHGYARVKVTRSDEKLAVRVARNIVESDAARTFGASLTAAVLA